MFYFPDEDVHSRVQERLLAARAKQQAEHERVAREMKEREEERRRIKEEERKKVRGKAMAMNEGGRE